MLNPSKKLMNCYCWLQFLCPRFWKNNKQSSTLSQHNIQKFVAYLYSQNCLFNTAVAWSCVCDMVIDIQISLYRQCYIQTGVWTYHACAKSTRGYSSYRSRSFVSIDIKTVDIFPLLLFDERQRWRRYPSIKHECNVTSFPV